MKSRGPVFLIALCCGIFGPSLAHPQQMCGEEGEPVATIPPTGNIGVVAVYAYSTATGDPDKGPTLPDWWDDLWNNDARSIQTYWRDASYSQHDIQAAVPISEVPPGEPKLAWVPNYPSGTYWPRTVNPDFCTDILSQVDAPLTSLITT